MAVGFGAGRIVCPGVPQFSEPADRVAVRWFREASNRPVLPSLDVGGIPVIGVLSGTEFLVVLLAVAALVVMGVATLVGIWTRLRRGIVDRVRRAPADRDPGKLP